MNLFVLSKIRLRTHRYLKIEIHLFHVKWTLQRTMKKKLRIFPNQDLNRIGNRWKTKGRFNRHLLIISKKKEEAINTNSISSVLQSSKRSIRFFVFPVVVPSLSWLSLSSSFSFSLSLSRVHSYLIFISSEWPPKQQLTYRLSNAVMDQFI